MRDKQPKSQAEEALAWISRGHPRLLQALVDMRMLLTRAQWRQCASVMIALGMPAEELWALYDQVCHRQPLAFARYMYAIRTGAAPVSTVRMGLHALTHDGDITPEQLRLRPYEGIAAPWMMPWIYAGMALFGRSWRWEGL